ncbi:MAG: glycerophosphodiester phosphodiesterase, partial [Actinobacteria bacterium]|nr:glycerophosphodiester phosphodiesterase [Actinomycetota bacterium]
MGTMVAARPTSAVHVSVVVCSDGRRTVTGVTLQPTARRAPSLEVTPAVVAHRGASGHRPEHTLEAFRVAIAMGADSIELDVVSTADGVLVVRHESDLTITTDVADHRELGGRTLVEELSLDEVRTLRVRERMPDLRPGAAAYDGRLAVASLDDVLALVTSESA